MSNKFKPAKPEGFAVGEWVQALVTTGDFKKSMIGVVSSKIKEEKGYNWEKGNYSIATGNFHQYVVFGSNNDYQKVDPKDLKKIATPKFAVAWATENNDPVERFNTLSEAQAFKTKILGKRFRGDKVIEANIYKLV